MRRVAIILTLILFSALSQATVRYISTQADFDALSGITLSAGDQILFEKGKTFYGSLTIAQSGALNNRITYGSYGIGANPIITGFTTVSSWANLGGNIWESTSAVSTLSNVNVVSISGVNTTMGKTPNSGYYTFQSHSGSTSITSSNLTGTPNWTGAEAVMRIGHFKWDRRAITSQSTGTINWTTNTSYEPEDNFGFFIQNDPRTLDVQNEWYYNPTTHKIRIYSTSQPSNVKISSVDDLMTVNASYITIENIDFEGANNVAIYSASTTVRQHITIQNCTFNFTGLAAIRGIRCSNFLIDSNSINNSGTFAIYSTKYLTNYNEDITNNVIQNTGMLIGMTQNMDAAITIGKGVNIEYNHITNSGFNGISFYGDSVTIKNNFIDTFCKFLDDGAGVYTFTGGQGATHNSKINGNIVINGIGAAESSAGTFPTIAAGIYCDAATNDTEVFNNSTANTANYGIFMNGNTNCSVHDNTVYNASTYSLRLNAWSSYDYAVNLNKFITKKSSQKAFYINSSDNTIPSKITANNNYYASPIGTTDLFYVEQPSTSSDRYFNLAEWKTFSSQDVNSLGSPKTITDVNDLQFYYNDTKADKVVFVPQPSIDMEGVTYSGNVTLQPFTSLVLIEKSAYYVSSSGSDTNDGLTESTPWQTLTKVNAKVKSAGDNYLFKRGDEFYGSLTVSQSGTSGNPITFGAYGTGANPIITGFIDVTAWTNLGGNIWESTSAVSSLSTCNMVSINGINTPMGREPDTGYYTITAHTGNTQVTIPALTGTPNWTGAELAFNTVAYVTQRCPITSQTGSVLTFTQPESFTIYYNLYGIIQNDIRTLDVQNEWYYNPTTKKISIYSTSQPTNVKVSSVDNLVTVTDKDYITLQDIKFTGSNQNSFYSYNNENNTILGCQYDFSGVDAISGLSGGAGSTNFRVENCTISNSNNSSIGLTTYFTNAIIKNNTVTNSGMIYGASDIAVNAGNSSGRLVGISAWGDGCLIEGNVLQNIGYNGITFRGSNTTVQKNYIKNYCQLSRDGGGIYTWNGSTGASYTNTKVQYNVIEDDDVITAVEDVSTPAIYFDFKSNGINVSYNTVFNAEVGIFLGGNWNITATNNTIYNTGIGIRFYGNTGTRYGGTTISNNNIIAKTADQYVFHLDPAESYKDSIISNYNYLARPIADTNPIRGYVRTPSFTTWSKTLSEWQVYSGQDANSKKSPKSISTVNDMQFVYNETSVAKTFELPFVGIDITGKRYVGASVTLQPYTSLVLIKDVISAPWGNGNKQWKF